MSGSAVQLLQCLSACLSPSTEVRQAAEAHLRYATKHAGYGPALLEIALNTAVPEHTRQLAGLTLKQYIKHHWVQGAKWFQSPEVNAADKAVIREKLLIGLADSSPKVRVALGLCVAGVAKWDWPQQWPGLMEQLLRAINEQQHSDAVKGALSCLSLLADDIVEEQLMDIGPAVLPQLLSIASNAPEGHAYMQRQAFHVVHGVMNALSLVHGGKQQRAARDALAPLMQPYIQVLCKILESPVTPENVDYWGVKLEALKLVVVALTYFRKLSEPFLPQLLTSCWQLYTSSLLLFESGLVEGSRELPQDQADDDGDPVDLETLISQMFEVLLTVVGNPHTKSHLKAVLPEMVYLSMRYMQMPEEQVHTWSDDPNQYLADEMESVYTVRASGEVLIDQVVKEFEYHATGIVMAAAERCINEAQAAQQHGRSSWWKLREAALFAVGTAADSLNELIEPRTAASKQLQQQLQHLMDNVLAMDISGEGSKCPFLVGRALWIASELAAIVTPQQLAAFQQAAASGLNDSMPPAVQMGACRALAELCPKVERQSLAQFAPQILGSLVQLLGKTSEDSLNLVLETMTAIIKVSPEAASAHQRDIAAPVLRVWESSVNDPFISTATLEVLEALINIPSCLPGMAQQVVPALTHVLHRPATSKNEMLLEASLELLEKVVKAGDTSIAEGVWMAIAHPLLQIMSSSYDDGVLQNGCQLLASLVRVGGTNMLSWGNQEPQQMLQAILQVLYRLLHPDLGDSGSIFTGDLFQELLLCMPNQVAPHIPGLLQAVVTKLASKDTSARTLASLLLVLCHLARLNARQLLDALSAFQVNTAGVSGKDGLQVAADVWMEHIFDISGSFNSKVAAAGVISVLQSQHPALTSVQVQGKLIESNSTGVRTRAAAAREGGLQYTSVPLVVKIVTVLVRAVMFEQERVKDDVLPGWEEDSAGEWESDDDEFEEENDENDEGTGQVERTQSVGGLQIQGSSIQGTQGGIGNDVSSNGATVLPGADARQMNDPVYNTTVAALAADALKKVDHAVLQAALQELTPKQATLLQELVQS